MTAMAGVKHKEGRLSHTENCIMGFARKQTIRTWPVRMRLIAPFLYLYTLEWLGVEHCTYRGTRKYEFENQTYRDYEMVTGVSTIMCVQYKRYYSYLLFSRARGLPT